MTHRSDEDLFLAYQRERDCQALGTLFRRRVEELLRLAVFLAARPSDAEDLVQATFLSAISHAESFRPDGRVMSWLCGILTNHARMLRRAERRPLPNPQSESAADDDPMHAALRAELRATLDNGIANLPEPYRAVLQLYLREGLDSREIARRLARPRATVRKQMERAIDRLRLALPVGLATGLVMRMSPAQMAANAAEAARFVGPLEPRPQAAPVSNGWGLAALVAGALVLGASIWAFAGNTPDVSPDQPRQTVLVSATAPERGGAAAPISAPIVADSSRTDVAETARLRVLAVDAAGTPRTDVELLLIRCGSRTRPERISDPDTLRGRTDEHGIVTFSQLVRGFYELARPGTVPRGNLEIMAGANETRLVLPPPSRISGTVVDHRGYPISGAEIVITQTLCRGEAGAVVAETGPDGYFTATTDFDSGRVFARHRDYAGSSTMRLEDGLSARLTLEPSRRRIVVSVVDGKGRPLPSCYVGVAPRSTARVYVLSQHGRTDADGSCAFDDPGAIQASIVASRRDLAPSIVELPADASEVVVRLTSGGSVSGRAVNADGSPLAGCVVAAAIVSEHSNAPAGPLVTRQVRTAADGAFAFPTVPTGRLKLSIDGTNFGEALHLFLNQFVIAGAEIEVGEGEAHEVQLTARRCCYLAGSMHAPSGEALVGWHVVAMPSDGNAVLRLARSRTAQTREDGAFAIPGVVENADYDIGVFPPGAKRSGLDFPLVTARAVGGSDDARLVVDVPRGPGSQLSCRLLLPDGRAAALTSVELRRTDFWFPSARMTAADGSCRFGRLPPGEYWLSVDTPVSGRTTLSVDVPDDGRDLDLGTVQLEAAARLSVSLHGAGVARLRGVRVVARMALGDRLVGARTDRRGVATFRALPPGTAQLLVHGPGIAPHMSTVELTAGPKVFDVEVERACSVPMRFLFAPVDNPFVINGPLLVEVRSANGDLVLSDNIGETSAPGVFELATGLLPGRYQVRATSLWNATGLADLAVAANTDNSVKITLDL